MKTKNILKLFLTTAFLLFFSTGVIHAQAWIQLGDDFESEAEGDYLGSSVSLNADGTILAIGAKGNDGGGDIAGHVRVYEYNELGWNQIGNDIDGEQGLSGWSVSLNEAGTTVAIGAIHNSGNGYEAGHVRVFEYNGFDWIQMGNDIDGEAAEDESGRSVSLNADGTIVAIGAAGNDGNGAGAGHVRVYEYDGLDWTQMGDDIDGEAAGDISGFSASLNANGTIVAIGAHGNDGNGAGAGHVRVYEYDGLVWNQVGNDIDGEATGDNSGISVSLNAVGTIVAIGAKENDGGGENAGHVRVYEYNGFDWNQVGNDIDGLAEDDEFGGTISLNANGTIVAIGARGLWGGENAGHVWVYEYDGFNWNQIGNDIYMEPFDMQVSINADGKIMVIGSPYSDATGNESGLVRAYSLTDPRLAEMRYFFNEDPGASSGHLYAEYDPPVNEIIDNFDRNLIDHADELEEGFNMLYFRFKDANGNWSLSEGRSFYILPEEESIPAISELRYFFNEDPGVEHSNNHLYETYDPAVPIVDKTANINLDVHSSELEEGFNMLYFRFKDEAGNWSLAQGRSFYIFNETVAKPISAYEWFINTDPGVGATGNTTVIDPPVEIFDGVIPIEISGYAPGIYNLFIRVMDEDGNWSLSHYDSFEIVRGISLKFYLEGPYVISPNMETDLQDEGLIPLQQPYSGTPWNYNGTETVEEIPPDVVDWVYLEFHDTDDPANADETTIIDSKAAFLLKDGSVVDLDGSSSLMYALDVPLNNLYVAVYHRNHLAVLSNMALMESPDHIYEYDFTTPADQAFGIDAQKDLKTSGVFGLFGGDANANGTIEITDKVIWEDEAGKAEYNVVDLNLDGQADNKDKDDVWVPNEGESSQVPY